MDPASRRADETEPAEQPLALPGWIPALLGVVLVAMGALAVYTGLTYRAKPVVRRLVRKATALARLQSAPGEPQAGASRVIPGSGGEEAPKPYPASKGTQSGVSIQGTASGVEPLIRLAARRGAILKIVPAEANFYVNDRLMGPVHQYSTPEEAYEFPAEGRFTIRVSADGYSDSLFEVTVGPEAKAEVVRIETRMQKVSPSSR